MRPRGAWGFRTWPLSARIGAAMFSALAIGSALVCLFSSWSAWDGDDVHGQLADGRPVGPGMVHWLGTDRLLRDVALRLAMATLHSMHLTLVACALTGLIAISLGCAAGYFEQRWLDKCVQWTLDVMLGFPSILLLMAAGSVLRRVDTSSMAALIAAVSWPWMTTTIRARAIEISRMDFVQGVRALGARDAHILLRHVIPNVAPVAMRLLALSVAPMTLLEAALAYVGVGRPPPAPTLGRMLYEGQDAMMGAPWLVLAPALVLTWVGVSTTLLSNALVAQRRS